MRAVVPHRPCPICGGDRSRVVFRELSIDLRRCAGCGHVFSTFAAERDYAGYWGEAEPGAGAGAGAGGEHDDDPYEFYWNRARMPVYRQFLRRYAAHRGRLLDVGAGIGYFVKAACDAGWEGHGYEISPAAVAIGRERLGVVNLFAGRVEESDYGEGFFDAVTLWDVIEHIPDPVPLLGWCRHALKPGGLLFVQTPSIGFHLPRARLLRWWRQDPAGASYLEARDHLNDFCFRSLRMALVKAGFDRMRFEVLRPTYSLAGGRGIFGVAAKVGYYWVARALFAASLGAVNVANTIHAAAWTPIPRPPT